MAINFGNMTATSDDEENLDTVLEKAMANLNKISSPILKETLKHPSKTQKTNDPAKGIAVEQQMLQDVPSTGEILLGGVTGAISGFLSGQDFTFSEDNPGGTTAGKAVGAAVGGFLGSASYSGGRKSGAMGQQVMGVISGVAGQYKQTQQQKIAEDAVGSAVQSLGELNNPGNDPKKAAANAAAREQIAAGLAQRLVKAGMAPDKALATSQNVVAINAPNLKEAQDPGLAAQRAIANYEASPKGPEDKQQLKTTLDAIYMGSLMKLGKLPTNPSALMTLAGDEAGTGEGPTAGEPVQQPNGQTGFTTEDGLEVEPVGAASGGAAAGAGGGAPSQASGSSKNQLPSNYAKVPEDVKKMEVAATQVGTLGQQAIDMLQNDPALQSALTHKKGVISTLFGTSPADAYANGIGVGVPFSGGTRLGQIGKNSPEANGLSPEEADAVNKFNQLLTPLAQAAGKMRDPGVLQGQEYNRAKDVTASLTLSPDQNVQMISALIAEAQNNLELAKGAPVQEKAGSKKKNSGIVWLKTPIGG